MSLTKQKVARFKKQIWQYYRRHGRDLAWRHTDNPYHILISEIMLQQTQVARVVYKYPLFLTQFPDIPSLARAPLSKILRVWQGMGYNRRALAFQKLSREILKNHQGNLPRDPALLEQLPGIGTATAGAIAAFAFNHPSVFIETNIRRVFIHFFFPRKKIVADEKIIPLIAQTLDQKNPREWYYALMDYGAMLADTIPNPNRKSSTYHTQSRFPGSRRELRGKIIAYLAQKKSVTEKELVLFLHNTSEEKIKEVIILLIQEGFLTKRNRKICIRA